MSLPVDAAKATVGLHPSCSVHVRLGEHGAPVDCLRRFYDTDSFFVPFPISRRERRVLHNYPSSPDC
jgi:hypothetical protein